MDKTIQILYFQFKMNVPTYLNNNLYNDLLNFVFAHVHESGCPSPQEVKMISEDVSGWDYKRQIAETCGYARLAFGTNAN